MFTCRHSRLMLVAVSCLLIFAAQPALSADNGFCVALVSDTHLGRTSAQQMTKVIEDVNASSAELVFFLGDLVESGAKHEDLYPQWVSTAKGLNKPWRAVPGNHDPVDLFCKYVHPETDYVIDHKGWRFILFNDANTNSHDGFITDAQFDWIEQKIEEASAKKMKSILITHVAGHKNLHPDVGWWIKDDNGGKRLAGIFEKHRAAMPVFFSGHFHCGMRGWDDRYGVNEVIIPAIAWNTNRKLESAPGWCIAEHRSGYVLAEFQSNAIILKYKPVGADVAAEKKLVLPN